MKSLLSRRGAFVRVLRPVSFFFFLLSSFPFHSVVAAQSLPFAVGETLVYDVSWSSYVTAGEATLSVQERSGAGRRTVFHVVAQGRPSGLVASLFTLYYKVESWLNAGDLLAQRSRTYTEEGRRKHTTALRFDRAGQKATFEEGSQKKAIAVPPRTQDPLSALYALRALHLTSGQRLSIPIVNEGELYRIAVTTGPRETIACGLGTVQALRVDMNVLDPRGERVGQALAVWLTTGRRQIPVQMTAGLPIGNFRLVLREARGLAPAAPR